ncbi:hypothetical protein [Lentisalinibacter salinarum]|uniref:hypothetical protein n=1 Tax=Lentisalinibacter salinarum TaxID=2992239 RepID=UPI0038689D8B
MTTKPHALKVPLDEALALLQEYSKAAAYLQEDTTTPERVDFFADRATEPSAKRDRLWDRWEAVGRGEFDIGGSAR